MVEEHQDDQFENVSPYRKNRYSRPQWGKKENTRSVTPPTVMPLISSSPRASQQQAVLQDIVPVDVNRGPVLPSRRSRKRNSPPTTLFVSLT